MYELNAYCGQQASIIVTKPNTLVEARHDLTMAEHDLITLAINKLYVQKSDNNQVLISAKEYANANRVCINYAYRVLKDFANALPSKKLTITLYKDHSAENSQTPLMVKPRHSNYTAVNVECDWVEKVEQRDQVGYITIYFSKLITDIIQNTGKAYTKYDYVKTLDFKGSSTKRLYELVLKWQDVGKIPAMTIDDWKDYFGRANDYPQVNEFRRRVLDFAIHQINAQGEFEITLEPHRLGRRFTHFSMRIKKLKSTKVKNPSKATPSKTVNLMSQKQADMFAKLLANDTGFGSKFARAGEAMSGFINRTSHDLQRDLGKMAEYMPYLVSVGFKEIV